VLANLPVIAMALAEWDNPDFAIVELPGLYICFNSAERVCLANTVR